MEFRLLGAAAVGIGALYAVLFWEARRGNAADCSRSLWDTALTAAVVGLAAGRLAAMVIAGTNPLARPRDVIIVRGGVDTVWATAAALITLAVVARRELLVIADALAAAVLAGLAGWHAGCLVTETCLGTPSDLPWAYALPGSSVTRHPVELYAAGLYAVTAVGMMVWRRRRPPPAGVVGAAALAVAAGVRLATEPLRPVLGTGMERWYLVGIAAGAIAAWLLWRRPAKARYEHDL